MIVPKAAVTRAGSKSFAESPIGTGPYKFVSQRIGRDLKLEAWDKYWNSPKASIQNVIFQIVPDQASRIAQFRAGDLDFVVDIDPTQVDALKQAGETVIANPMGVNLWILFRPEMAKLNDPRVGQAFNLAVNRDSIIKNIYLGYAKPIASLNSSPAYIDPKLEPYPYDPEKARHLLEQADFDFSQTLSMNVPIGRYLKGEDVAEAVRSDLAKVGVNVKVNAQEYANFLEDGTSKRYGALAYTNAPNVVYDPIPITRSMAGCGQVYSYWCDEALETRFQNLETLDGQARMDAIHEFDRYVHDNPPGIFLHGFQQINAMKANIQWDATPSTRVIYLTSISYK